MRLGPQQLHRPRAIGTTGFLIRPDKRSKRLVELGLLATEPDGTNAVRKPGKK